MPFKDQIESYRNIQGIRYVNAEDVPASVALKLAAAYRDLNIPARCYKLEEGMSRVFVEEKSYQDAINMGQKMPRWDDTTVDSVRFE